MTSDRNTSERLLEPQRKLISILFADVKGSTRMIAALDPEDAWTLLKTVISAMEAAIHRFDGVVSKEAGDGVMAFFGAPIASDDHAELACLAALALQKEIAELGHPDVQIRVGIHSGEVVLHQVQHDFSSVYDAAGGVVHITQKIQACAEPGGTLISGACQALLHGRFNVAPFCGELRGLDEPMELFTLKELWPVTRWEARAAIGLSPFVGRRTELQTLLNAAQFVRSGASRLVMIEGEPGAGKSRLLHEFLAHPELRDWQIWRCDAETMTRQVTWNVARRLLTTALGDGDLQSIRNRVVEFTSVLSNLDQLALSSLLGTPVTNADWVDTTPAHRSRLMCRIFATALLGAHANAGKPTALVLEDLQWIDTESLEALETLHAASAEAALLILASRRASETRAVFANNGDRIVLPSLAPVEANQLLGTLLGDAVELERIKEKIVAHTGGTPLFVEEVVRHLIASKFFVEADGAYLPQNPRRPFGIPPTIQGVIAARIDQLNLDARALLQVASVLGNGAAKADLLAVCETQTDISERVFAELQRTALLRAASTQSKEEAIFFAHDLIREVAYSGLLRARRRELHRRALDHLIRLESLGGGRAALLYRHAARAEDWEAVVGYARRAAAEAIEQSAYWNSLEYSDAAIDALTRLPMTKKNTEIEIDLRLEARLAFGATAQMKRLLSYAEDAERDARRIQDNDRMIAASTQKTLALTFVGTPDETLPVAESTLQQARAHGIPQIEAVACYFAGQAYYMAGHYRVAEKLMAEAFAQLPSPMRLARLGTTGTTSVLVKVLQATSLASMGEFVSAQKSVADAVAITAQTRRPYDQAAIAYGTGYAALLQGRVGDTIALVQPMMNMVKQHDIVFFLPVLANTLGQAFIAAGKPEDGIRILQEGLRIATKLSYVGVRLGISLSLGVAQLVRGDLHQAAELIGSCLGNARQQGYRGIHANAARYAAMVEAKRNVNAATVPRLLDEAIEVSTAIEARPSAAIARLVLAEFLIGTSERAAAAASLTIAAKEFERMGMAAYARRAQQLMRQLEARS
jgi:class 3 adenylate cyclase